MKVIEEEVHYDWEDEELDKIKISEENKPKENTSAIKSVLMKFPLGIKEREKNIFLAKITQNELIRKNEIMEEDINR